MAASKSNFETQNGSDKKRIKFDEEIFRDVDKFPVNFSGVPHIGERIFGYLDFEDFNSCRTVCKVWFNLLYGNRNSWIKLLEKERFARSNLVLKIWILMFSPIPTITLRMMNYGRFIYVKNTKIVAFS